jgi:quinol monooxygenase YgiN
MVVTEIALLPLRADINLNDQTNSAAQTHSAALQTVLAQPGTQRIYWGRQVEDPLLLIWLVEWEDVEHHKIFMSSKYAILPVRDGVLPLTRGKCVQAFSRELWKHSRSRRHRLPCSFRPSSHNNCTYRQHFTVDGDHDPVFSRPARISRSKSGCNKR